MTDAQIKNGGVTKVHFAQMCMRMSRVAAAWGADGLDCLVDQGESSSTVERFIAEMRSRLDHLEEQSGLSQKPAA